jgi:hypothetical protein
MTLRDSSRPKIGEKITLEEGEEVTVVAGKSRRADIEGPSISYRLTNGAAGACALGEFTEGPAPNKRYDPFSLIK